MRQAEKDRTLKRCHWCTDDPDYIRYHDTEWGVPSTDTRYLFEMLVLEGFQAGLSWLTVLKKRPRFREVFFDFDVRKLAEADDAYLETLTQDAGIIRHKGKIFAARNNAQAWLKLADPVDTMWSVTEGRRQIHHIDHPEDVPATSTESAALSRLLKKNGFTFVGPTICQAYLQAVGVLMQHTTDCFRHAQLQQDNHSVKLRHINP